MKDWLKVGAKVVCVNDKPRPEIPLPFPNAPKAGEVCIVRWVGMYYHPYYGIDLCIRVEGYVRPCEDMPMLASRFRPVITTDISIFEAMLTKAPNQMEPA